MKFAILSYTLIYCYVSLYSMTPSLSQSSCPEISTLEKLEQDYEEFLRTKMVRQDSRLSDLQVSPNCCRPDLERLAVVTYYFRTLEEEAKSPEENFKSLLKQRRPTSALKYLNEMSGELPGKAVESCPFMPLDHPLVVEIRRRLNPNNEFEFLVNQIKRCVKEGSVTDFKQHLSTREYSPPGQVALINKCVKAGRLECLKEMSNEFNIHPVFLAEAGPEGTLNLGHMLALLLTNQFE